MKTLLSTNGYVSPFDGLSFVDDALRSFYRARPSAPLWSAAPALGRGVRSAWAGAPDFAVDTNDDGWTLRAELPGVSPESLELEAHGSRLIVRGKRELEVPEGYRALRRERAEIAFERSFDFARGFDAENVKAELKHGVLHVSIPMRAEEKPRAISVEVG